jgi:hypothetical protein
MVANLARGASVVLFGLVARNGLERGLHSVAPFGARPAAPATLGGVLQAQDRGAALSVTSPPCHATMPICHHTTPRHVATMPIGHHTTPSAAQRLSISMAWLGPFHNKYYDCFYFSLPALSSPRPPLALPAATAATAEPRGVGPPIPPCVL